MSMIENYDARFVKLERKAAALARRIKALESGGAVPAKKAAPAKKAPAKRAQSTVAKATARRGRPSVRT